MRFRFYGTQGTTAKIDRSVQSYRLYRGIVYSMR
jgi:hypothetical protein